MISVCRTRVIFASDLESLADSRCKYICRGDIGRASNSCSGGNVIVAVVAGDGADAASCVAPWNVAGAVVVAGGAGA